VRYLLIFFKRKNNFSVRISQETPRPIELFLNSHDSHAIPAERAETTGGRYY
jgi:hypothetical protein